MPNHTRWQSFRCAVHGVKYVVRTQRNAHIELAFAALVALGGGVLRLSSAEWILLAFCMGGVFAAEMFNTAIEAFVDLLAPEHHDAAGMAKDCAAGGVLVASTTAAVVGVLIFVPAIGRRLGEG